LTYYCCHEKRTQHIYQTLTCSLVGILECLSGQHCDPAPSKMGAAHSTDVRTEVTDDIFELIVHDGGTNHVFLAHMLGLEALRQCRLQFPGALGPRRRFFFSQHHHRRQVLSCTPCDGLLKAAAGGWRPSTTTAESWMSSFFNRSVRRRVFEMFLVH
jgi:hypothetical protein